MRVQAALLGLLTAAALALASPPVGPAKVTVGVGELGRVEVAPFKPDGKEPLAVGWRCGTTDDRLFVDELAGKGGKVRLLLQGKAAGTYLIVLWSAGETDSAVIEVEVKGAEPVKPDTKPDTKPTPGKVSRVRTVIVSESADAAVRKSLFAGDKELLALYAARKWDAPQWVDPQTVDPATGKAPAKWAPYIERAKGKDGDQLYLVDLDANGEVLSEGPLPATPADLIALLKKVAP